MKYKKYPKYKDSGVEWIGEIPEHWKKFRTGMLCDFTNGYAYSENEFSDSGYPIIRIQNLNGGTNFVYSQVKLPEKQFAETNDLLFAWSATFGPYIWNGPKAAYHYHQWKITPKKIVNRKFLYYFLDFMTEVVRSMSHSGIGMVHMTKTSMEKLTLYVPDDKTEIKQIAEFLDKKTSQFDELITKSKKQITIIEEKKQATINQAVTKGLDPSVKMKDSGVEWIGKIPEGWEAKKIKRDTPIMRGASPRPIDDKRFFDDEGEYAWVRISDVTRSNGTLQKTTQRLSDEGSSLSVKLRPGELFLSIAGSVGKPCVTDIKCCIHDGFAYFPNLTINKKILYYLFEAGKCYGGLGKLGTQLNLNTYTVGNIKIPVPPKPEQSQIAEFLDKKTTQFDKLIAKSKKQITILEEKRQALITAAVTGKIDVRSEAIA